MTMVGDILVLANFSNGGAQATIEVLEWVSPPQHP
jgi:hypothetical protein